MGINYLDHSLGHKNKRSEESVAQCLSLNMHDMILYQLPGIFAAKDIYLNILAVNDVLCKLLGFQSIHELVGLTDYDVRCDAVSFAEQFREEDKMVISKNKTLTFLNIIKYADGSIYRILSNKKPIYDANTNQIIGLSCYGTFLNEQTLATITKNLLRTDQKFSDKSAPSLGCYYLDELPTQEIILTKKQSTCLFYLLRGKTNKLIGKILNISPRTVEKHVEIIKYKFDCGSKSELIEKAMHLGYLQLLTVT